MFFSDNSAIVKILGRIANNLTPVEPPPPPKKLYNFSVEVPFREAVVTIQLNAQPPVPGDDTWLCHADIRRHGIYESRYHEQTKFSVVSRADHRCDALRDCIAALPDLLSSWRTDEGNLVFHAHAVEYITGILSQHMQYFEIEQRKIADNDSE